MSFLNADICLPIASGNHTKAHVVQCIRHGQRLVPRIAAGLQVGRRFDDGNALLEFHIGIVICVVPVVGAYLENLVGLCLAGGVVCDGGVRAT